MSFLAGRIESVEKQISEVMSEMRGIHEKPDPDDADRERFARLSGAKESLEEQYRALRDAERDELKSAIESRETIGETPEDTKSEDFRHFIRTGEVRASATTTDANGGVLVPEPVWQTVIDKIYNYSTIAADAGKVTLTDGDTVYLPIKTAHAATAWVAETAARGETNSPTFGSITLKAYDLYANAYASQTLLDSADEAEAMLVDDMAKSVAQAAGTAFALGTGSGATQPDGLFANVSGSYPYTLMASGSNDVLVAAKLIEGYYTLPVGYHAGAAWYMKPATLATISQMSHGSTLTTFPLVQYGANGAASILGKPVRLCDDAPAIGNGAYPVAYGDLSQGYKVAVHRNFGILRDPYTAKPYVAFYGLTRVGGVPADNQAVVLFKSDT
jgi:HK97 family phage major capsid protein